jgi:hypothetical protein
LENVEIKASFHNFFEKPQTLSIFKNKKNNIMFINVHDAIFFFGGWGGGRIFAFFLT